MANKLAENYGPWAVIAGGSEGIGLCFARQLAAAGIHLVLLARRSEPLAEAHRELTGQFPVEVRTHALDLTAEDLDRRLEEICGSLEVGLLVYNAGAMHGVVIECAQLLM